MCCMVYVFSLMAQSQTDQSVLQLHQRGGISIHKMGGGHDIQENTRDDHLDEAY